MSLLAVMQLCLGLTTAQNHEIQECGTKSKSLLQVDKACSLPETGWYSQSEEDKILYKNFFCNKRDGIFVELGALDGVRYSNSKFFEDVMGWRGGLFEGSPESAQLLQKNRPSLQNLIIPEAVCAEGVQHVEFVLSSRNAAVNGVPDNMAPSFKHTFYGDHMENHVNVSCRPLGSMLEELANHTGSDHVDFFSLDVEGAELAVLETNNWKVPVRLFLVEMDGRNKEKDEAVRELLRRRGYVKSNVFVPRSEVFILENR